MKTDDAAPEICSTLDSILSGHGGSIHASGDTDSDTDNGRPAWRRDRPDELSTHPTAPSSLSDSYLEMLARDECARRDLRDEIMSGRNEERIVLRGAAFDILLDLYLLKFSGRRISIGEGGGSFHGPATTAARWLDLLLHNGLVLQTEEEGEGGKAYLELSEKGEKIMRDYFVAVHTHGM